MSSLACASRGCSATICISGEVERRLRRTHETFYCPAGHSNYFPGKTDEEKKIEQLRDLIDEEERRHRQTRRWLAIEQDTFRSCPFDDCTWRSKAGVSRVWRSMLRHFEKTHVEHLRLVKAAG